MRAVLKWFALAMESKLKKNDWKIGWSNMSLLDAITGVEKELRELTSTSKDDDDAIMDEAVDVANRAMMVWDIARNKLVA